MTANEVKVNWQLVQKCFTPEEGSLILAYRNVEILNDSFNKSYFYLLNLINFTRRAEILEI